MSVSGPAESGRPAWPAEQAFKGSYDLFSAMFSANAAGLSQANVAVWRRVRHFAHVAVSNRLCGAVHIQRVCVISVTVHRVRGASVIAAAVTADGGVLAGIGGKVHASSSTVLKLRPGKASLLSAHASRVTHCDKGPLGQAHLSDPQLG